MQFSVWGSNIAGGFLRSGIEQDKEASFAYNLKLAQLADRLGYHAILLPVRYIGGIGGGDSTNGQLDPVTLAAALAAATTQIRFISAVLPGFIPPVTLAKMGATIDHISSGRWHVNLVTGWFQEEQEMFGVPWIAHEERYSRSEEYIEILKGLWQQEAFTFDGRYYKIKEGRLRPAPYQQPYPAIFQGGNSPAARSMAGRLSDWYFINGAPLDEIKEQIREVREIASSYGRTVRFAVNAFVIARATEQEAQEEYRLILEQADHAAVRGFQEKAKGAKGMWGNASTVSDFVANNEGFRTGLVGSYSQIAQKIRELESAGVHMLLSAFRFPLEEVVRFHDYVLPLTSFIKQGMDAR
ncbi:LLM class flavin-dependent oxidoreductase [Paenibacillus validus]|uniref:LLM class flavin-dependent oxidoreductase n=2 Tax=Paenibacillus TaxID=44249 RepID=A0A7X2Z971_9BACL|nr:LLM class flavin-dependent oxidoreductase [Paenibacillus validus]